MRLERRNASMQLFLAIWYSHGLNASGCSVSRMRRSAETKTSCVTSSARPWSLTIPST